MGSEAHLKDFVRNERVGRAKNSSPRQLLAVRSMAPRDA